MRDVSTGRYIDRFTALVQKEYATHHDVEYYARQLCITLNYLNKIIKQALGTTAHLYRFTENLWKNLRNKAD